MTTYLYAGLGGLILILGGLLWWRGNQLDNARGELTAYRAAQAQAVADAVRVAHIKAQEAEARNAQVMADLQGKLDGSIADGIRLAARLRLALVGIHTSPVPETPSQPGTAPASGESSEAEVARRTLAAFADYDAACVRDAARLDAWIAEIRPQL